MRRLPPRRTPNRALPSCFPSRIFRTCLFLLILQQQQQGAQFVWQFICIWMYVVCADIYLPFWFHKSKKKVCKLATLCCRFSYLFTRCSSVFRVVFLNSFSNQLLTLCEHFNWDWLGHYNEFCFMHFLTNSISSFNLNSTASTLVIEFVFSFFGFLFFILRLYFRFTLASCIILAD